MFVGGLELEFLLECFDGRWVLKLGLMLGLMLAWIGLVGYWLMLGLMLSWIGLVGYWVSALFDKRKKVY